MRGCIQLLLGLLAAGCGTAQGVILPAAPTDQAEEPPDPVRAEAARHAAACNRNEPSACFQLGVLYERGPIGYRDDTHAATLFSWACHHSHAAACTHLGTLYEQGRGVAADKARAVSLYSKACDAGDAAGCSNVGGMQERACDGGDAASCSLLAERLAKGLGMTRDDARAATLYSKACDAGEAASCFELAVLVQDGRGVSQDATRAASLYKRACEGNDLRGCINFHTDACDAGDAGSCFELGAMFDDGRGVSSDPARAVELYSKACKGGDERACAPEKLQKHYATMLRALAWQHFPACKEDAPYGAARVTTAGARVLAGAPELPESDKNMALGLFSMDSSWYEHASGSARSERAKKLLSAPATLVVDVESYVSPRQNEIQKLLSRFTPGTARVRQVRFDARARPVCETRVTVENGDLRLRWGDDWKSAALQQLRDDIRQRF